VNPNNKQDITKELTFVEIYPNILVYKNVFQDTQKMYDIIKNFPKQEEDNLFENWSQWSRFGDYINYPMGKNFNKKWSYENLKTIEPKNSAQEDQKYFLLELSRGFDKVTEDYLSKFGSSFNFNKDEVIQTYDGESVPLWDMYGPSISRYHKDPFDSMSMTYHSDFIREPIYSPGYKFAITANSYINDDYEGGEIDFFVSGELIKYKPEAGDWLVFPSGHPEVLKKEGNVYLHGVFPSSGNHKYFTRMYWKKYSFGSQEWFEKEQEFGREKWYEMQKDIMEKYNSIIEHRNEIPEGVRVK
jgi:hypothetical protein